MSDDSWWSRQCQAQTQTAYSACKDGAGRAACRISAAASRFRQDPARRAGGAGPPGPGAGRTRTGSNHGMGGGRTGACPSIGRPAGFPRGQQRRSAAPAIALPCSEHNPCSERSHWPETRADSLLNCARLSREFPSPAPQVA